MSTPLGDVLDLRAHFGDMISTELQPLSQVITLSTQSEEDPNSTLSRIDDIVTLLLKMKFVERQEEVCANFLLLVFMLFAFFCIFCRACAVHRNHHRHPPELLQSPIKQDKAQIVEVLSV